MRSCSSLPTGSSANAVTTAVSKPKQRFSPRATLYSPPPSHTSKERAVAMRRSPGSNRSMISPKLTMSQRHSFFGLITKPMRSPRPVHSSTFPADSDWSSRFLVSRLRRSVDASRLQCGSEYLNYGERHQVCGTGNHERNHVTPGPLEHVPHHRGDEKPADGAGHAPDSHDRAHCTSRKHVGGQGKEVGGKALMAGGCEPDEQNRGPSTFHAIGKHHWYYADGADQHGRLASSVDGAAALNE